MRIDRRFKPEVAVSKSERNPVICNPRLDTHAQRMVATDGYVAVSVPVIIEDDDTAGAIPVDALKLARGIGEKDDPIQLNCNGTVEVPGVASFQRHTQGEFPDMQSAFDGFPAKPAATFAINAEKLLEAAKALGGSVVQVEVFGRTKPLRITPLHGHGGVAVIAPIRVSGDD